MIILVEPVCQNWIHEEVNAGLLKLVFDSTGKEIMFIAEKKHIECISKIYPNKKIIYKELKVIKSNDEADQYQTIGYYYFLLIGIQKKYRPTNIFITCAYRPCILAAELMAFWNKKARIHVVLHGMVEKNKKNASSYTRLLKFSRFCSNLNFITFSPYCTTEYWGIKSGKIKFLHHPYIKAERYAVAKNDKMIIGIIGACANQKALHLIKTINHRNDVNGYEFQVASRFGNRFRGISNVKLIDLSFERKSMERQIQQMDYLLLLYGKGEYEVSASGVFWDAVSNEVPCLVLDCKYFDYYKSYNIGYQAKSISELCNIVTSHIMGNMQNKEYYVGIDELEKHNKEVIISIINDSL